MRAVNKWLRAYLLLAGLVVIFSDTAAAKINFFQTAAGNQQDIAALTAEKNVVSYLQQHHRLPDYYVTKKQARAAGWDARAGNLCQVLPGKAIGGDRFNNREQNLPSAPGRTWWEADINYHCGRRGADRLLFASDGLIYLSGDHYKNLVPVESR
ncbi:ribonuclease [Rahnella sp. SAP-1]|uniref:Ribonuclease n=1 Tax=Rouxiella aceris TaxID=2703884 RepID=A0A848MJE1_9GAMM|nr:ribonuclease domain-containing protein [Rouxiella aceris]NMP28588.1 ribonuclease [Rouxiella aceris]